MHWLVCCGSDAAWLVAGLGAATAPAAWLVHGWSCGVWGMGWLVLVHRNAGPTTNQPLILTAAPPAGVCDARNQSHAMAAIRIAVGETAQWQMHLEEAVLRRLADAS